MSNTNLDGIAELRRAVRMLDGNNETFNQRFTAEELIKIARAHRLAAWDYYPDQWTEAQVAVALAGGVPQWTDSGEPVE